MRVCVNPNKHTCTASCYGGVETKNFSGLPLRRPAIPERSFETPEGSLCCPVWSKHTCAKTTRKNKFNEAQNSTSTEMIKRGPYETERFASTKHTVQKAQSTQGIPQVATSHFGARGLLQRRSQKATLVFLMTVIRNMASGVQAVFRRNFRAPQGEPLKFMRLQIPIARCDERVCQRGPENLRREVS